MSWERYFTPSALASALVDWVKLDSAPSRVLDLCAGSGNLLDAAGQKWPEAILYANDPQLKAEVELAGVDRSRQTTLDGLDFAVEHVSGRRRGYDVVVANPPFGKLSRLQRASSSARWLCDRAEQELYRVEALMTLAATFLLKTSSGTLLSIVPSTLVRGDKHRAFRGYLSTRFESIAVRPLRRGSFAELDLSLSFLALSHSRLGTADKVSSSRFSGEGPSLAGSFRPDICRGKFRSSELHDDATAALTLHVSGKGSPRSYVSRFSSPSSRRRQVVLPQVRRGDVIVARVGKNAGATSVYWGTQPALFSDCLLRVRVPSGYKRKVWRIVKSGLLDRELQCVARGLSARFITHADVERAILRGLRSK